MSTYKRAIILEATLFASWALILTGASALAQTTPTPTPAAVTQLKIAWDTPTDPTVLAAIAKYNVYVSPTAATGTPLKFASPTAFQVVAPATTFTFTNLADGKYFVAVTAVNAAGLESGYSNIIQATLQSTPPPPPTGLHILSQTVATQAKARTAKVNWSTDGPSKGKVLLYGAKPGNILDYRLDNQVGTRHAVKFDGLKPGRTYSYQVVVKTPSGGAGQLGQVTQFSL